MSDMPTEAEIGKAMAWKGTHEWARGILICAVRGLRGDVQARCKAFSEMMSERDLARRELAREKEIGEVADRFSAEEIQRLRERIKELEARP